MTHRSSDAPSAEPLNESSVTSRRHEWEKIVVVPVKVLPNLDDETSHQVMLEEDIEKAVDQAVVGCKHCFLPLNEATLREQCVDLAGMPDFKV